MANTHVTRIKGNFRVSATPPANPAIGDEYWSSSQKGWFRYTGNTWIGFNFTAGTVATAGPAGVPAPAGTHFSALAGYKRGLTAAPILPKDGEFFYDTGNSQLHVYDLAAGRWYTASLTTTTSTSTSTTSTSTSTTTTSTSSSTSTTTSTSTSSSTTTTL